MKNYLSPINPQSEKEKIVSFLKKTFTAQGIDRVVIGVSGGVDSAVSFSLLTQVLPPENIFVAHLYYEQSFYGDIEPLFEKADLPEKNISHFSIKHPVNEIAHLLGIENTNNEKNKMRKGNIAARTRMIVLFDLAKKHNALVCGTENKSENLLSYFTRFGDQASDIEPIAHLYKTHVYQLANYLQIPEEIIKQNPSAGLWQGQTDEGEFGFTYEEADQVMYLHTEKGMSKEDIVKIGLPNAEKIITWHTRHRFKHETPYTLS